MAPVESSSSRALPKRQPPTGRKMDPALDVTDLNRLRWRCRRGLLENDLFIDRFFQEHGATLTARQAGGLQTLMALADNDLLDLFLARSEPTGELDRPEVNEILALMRRPAAELLKKGTPP